MYIKLQSFHDIAKLYIYHISKNPRLINFQFRRMYVATLSYFYFKMYNFTIKKKSFFPYYSIQNLETL